MGLPFIPATAGHPAGAFQAVRHDGTVSATVGTPRRGSAVRPAATTAEIVAFAAVAHAGAGGALPSSGRLMALVVVTGAVCWALHQRVLRLVTASLLAAAAQLVVHLAGAAGSSPALHTGHGEHLGAATGASDSQMVLAHLLSGAVTVLALVHQEQALLVVVRSLTPAHVVHVPAHVAPSRPPTGDVVCVGPLVVVDAAPRRGPPALHAPARS